VEGIEWERLSTAGIFEVDIGWGFVDLRLRSFWVEGFVDNFVVWFGNVLLSDEFMVYFVDV
jgi:hypothetical protein